MQNIFGLTVHRRSYLHCKAQAHWLETGSSAGVEEGSGSVLGVQLVCVSAFVHQVPACSASALALPRQRCCCGYGSAAAEDGSPVVVGRVRMESSAIYAGYACFACAAACPVDVVYVCVGGAAEAVLSADDAVIVDAGLVVGLTVVRSSLSVRRCSGLAEIDCKDMVVISGPSDAYWYLVEHPAQRSGRALVTQT